ncbi:3-phosphoglycerate dehydrogenase [Candidatus Parcubacteria bacterium]|nr:MAG: 3-phosphoglycerate dehydrogenase [Candidatus Parcubacteria bacterium]
MPRPIIALTEPKGYSPDAIRTLSRVGEVLAWDAVRRDPERRRRTVALAVKLGVRVSSGMIDSLPNLGVIGTSTTGLNHIDMAAAARRRITVASLRGETKFLRSIFPTAEETIGLVIMLMRNLAAGYDAVRRGRWDKEELYGHELAGKTIGVIGFGRLGSMVARFARALGMRVLANDPYVSAATVRRGGGVKVSLERLLKESDVVSVHVLYTDAVKNLIGRKHFRLMRPQAIYINTARGELNDERALLEALQKKWIAGAALDVLANEDPKGGHVKNHPLVRYARNHRNLIIVPHLGGATFESMAKTEDFIAQKIVRTLKRF